MAQQSFAYLMKQCKKLFGGVVNPDVNPNFHYIAEVNQLLIKKSPCKKVQDFLILENIDEAMKVNVGVKLKRLTIEAFRLRDEWNKKEFINGPFALEVVQVALEHLRYTSFRLFKERVEKGDINCPQNLKNLQNLCKLYGLFNLYKDSKTCYECGYFDRKPYS